MNILLKKITVIAYVLWNLRTVKDVVRQMSKKSRFRKPLHKKHGKRVQTLLQSPRHYSFYIYWPQWIQLSWKKSLLAICKVLGLFVNTLTVHDTNSLPSIGNLTQLIQRQLPKKQRTFSQFFYILKKKTLIAYVFPILQTKKEVVRQISKKLFLKRPFNKWHGKQAETLLKSPRHDLYHIYWSLWRQLSWKKSLLSICKILELFLNTLTADDKYSLLNKDKLTQSIHMHLSKKEKLFLNFFFLIWNLD